MKKSFTLLALLALSQLASAVPAKRVMRQVRQSDGTTVTVVLRGDEHMHYYTTLDGVPVTRTATGDYTYARLQDHRLVPSQVLAHPAATRTAAEQQFINAAPAVRQQLSLRRNERLRPINEQRAKVAERRRQARRAPRLDAANESKKGLIILVNFKDKKLQDTSDKAAFDRFANTDGLTNDVNYGSIHDYFKAQSYGHFNVTFDIAGPVTVSQNMAYYGGKDLNNKDKAAEEMVYEAVKLADAQVNYKDYDWDGDGEVENIYVVYAGYGEASGADENTIWPHQHQLLASYTKSQLRFDGVLLNTYACGSELRGDGYAYDEDGYIIEDENGDYKLAESGELDGIGTMCHEFSHCLGLPDFYDTDYENFGMDMWSVMDAGCNNAEGFSPTNYTAYERWFSGWLEPIELKEPTIVKDMPALADEPVAYVIYNDKDHNEFYLLENKQMIGFDRGSDDESAAIMSHGLLITHVTYDQTAWYSNTVNNGKMQRMTIVPADGELYGQNDMWADVAPYEDKYYNNPTQANYNAYYQAYYNAYVKYLKGMTCDLWPNASYDRKTFNTALTDDSKPAAELNLANTDGKKLMHKPITDITETATGKMDNDAPIYAISFKFMGGKLVAAPTEPAAKDVTTNGFTATWTASADAATYSIQLREKSNQQDPMESLLLAETFEKLTAEIDGTKKVDDQLDDYMAVPGWSGENIFKGMYGTKVGNAKNGGSLTTPLLAPNSGTLTVLLLAMAYGKDASSMTVTLMNEAGNTLSTQEVEMGEEPVLLTFTAEEPCRIMFKPAKRAYISVISVFDGEFAEEDFEDMQQADVKQMAKAQTFTTDATSYAFTDLTAAGTYAFRVCAVDAEDNASAWTDWVEVTLTADGVVAVPTSRTTDAKWFDLSGRNIRRPAARGIYVRGGQKMVVK